MSNLALKSNLARLKAEIDIIDVEKLKIFPVGLSKLSNVENNEVVKKNVYDKLVAKVNNIDTSRIFKKTKYDTALMHTKKILVLVDLLKKWIIMQKLLKQNEKIPRITGLAATAALTIVENKPPDARNFVKKTDYDDAKIFDIKSKCFTTVDYNKFTSEKIEK